VASKLATGALGEAGEEQDGVVDVARAHLPAARGAAGDAALGPLSTILRCLMNVSATEPITS
jgi:hypothetical protein